MYTPRHGRNRRGDDKQAVAAGLISADGEARQRCRHAFGDVAEDHCQDADDEQAQAPRRQHGLDHAAVELPHDQAFDDGADDADRDRRDDQDRDPDVDAVMDRDRGAVAAHHHELAMRQLMMRIIPNTMASPRLIRASVAMA